jgi:hypothetical protein
VGTRVRRLSFLSARVDGVSGEMHYDTIPGSGFCRDAPCRSAPTWMAASSTLRRSGSWALAFEMALAALRLINRGDLANDVIAQKIITLAKAGERDPKSLCEGVLKDFRKLPPAA